MCPYVISCLCRPHSYCFHGSVSSPPPLFSILLCKKFHRVASNFLTLNHVSFVSTSFLLCSWFRVISTLSLSMLLCEKFHRVVSKNYLTWNPPTHRFSLRVDLSRVEETDESFIHVATLHLSFTVCWYFVPNKYASHKQCGKPLHSVRKHCHRCWLTTAPIFFFVRSRQFLVPFSGTTFRTNQYLVYTKVIQNVWSVFVSGIFFNQSFIHFSNIFLSSQIFFF